MTDNFLTPEKALSIALKKMKIVNGDFDKFSKNLQRLLSKIDEIEREENQKTHIRDFLRDSFYIHTNEINTKGNQDLVIHNGSTNKSSVGVIIEAKKPLNKSEMVSKDNLNSKALQELVLYYLRERVSDKNTELKQIIANSVYEWFVFDAQDFEKYFATNKQLVREFEKFENGEMGGKDTKFFYAEIASKYIEKIKHEISFVYFDLRDYQKHLNNQNDKELINLYKLFSPYFLLKQPFGNDSNTLDKGFYNELLHLIGLEETQMGGKKLIQRKSPESRDSASLLENTITQIEQQDKLFRLEKPSEYGDTKDQQLFNVGLELCITWINRVLFLKLLEGQLVSYNQNDSQYKFLNLNIIKDLDDLNNLFFGVLAKLPEDRSEDNRQKFARIPYLNSSLFEVSKLEDAVFPISQLRGNLEISIFGSTILKDHTGKKKQSQMATLSYLFEFLNSYDFGSENADVLQDEQKPLINASVLGLIFEKINGYKDGSFFTPGFITSYMAKETVQKAVVQKFTQQENTEIQSFEDLKNYTYKFFKLEDLIRYNGIINSLKIVDPAVGSGHFLVSVLNQILAIKSELGILLDSTNTPLKAVLTIENDELVITDGFGQVFSYNPQSNENQKIQQTLFLEKQKIIENCLFGVDINSNSVKICRLRLWIELLKNAYYLDGKEMAINSQNLEAENSPLLEEYPQSGGGVSSTVLNDTKIPRQPSVATPLKKGNIRPLQTLPNIDINIKTGNSLISRFSLDTPISEILKYSKKTIKEYQENIKNYQNTSNKEKKREYENTLNKIEEFFKIQLIEHHPLNQELIKLQSDLFKDDNKKQQKQIEDLEKQVFDLKNNPIYQNSFEWRFQFPQVLDENGDFIGFDVVIGNPPYIGEKGNKEIFQAVYQTEFGKKFYQGKMDLFYFFFHKSLDILADSSLLSFITTNYYITATGGAKLRQDIKTRSIALELINFNEVGIFESATGQHNLITTLQKKALPKI